jgi:hypothetical protein
MEGNALNIEHPPPMLCIIDKAKVNQTISTNCKPYLNIYSWRYATASMVADATGIYQKEHLQV